MNMDFTGACLLFMFVAGPLASLLAVNQDVTLGLTFFLIMLYRQQSIRSMMPDCKNVSLVLASLLFVVLGIYRIMFDVRPFIPFYIDDNLDSTKSVIIFGGFLVQMLILGAYCGLMNYKRSRFKVNITSDVKPAVASYTPPLNLLIIIAWVPLIANLILYFLVFKGVGYVDIHVLAHGPLRIIMFSIFLTYGSMIIMGSDSYSKDRTFKINLWLLLGFIVIYGVLLQLRSPLLACLLLVVYIYGHKVSSALILLLLIVSVVLFAIMGLVRDPSLAVDGIIVGTISSVLGLGELADTLRYVLEQYGTKYPLWGAGISGSFFGTLEPMANLYAEEMAPDFFRTGGGFGFFFLADLVGNFGKIGAPIFLFMIGGIFSRLFYSKSGMLPYVLLSAVFSNLFGITRNDLGSTMKGVVYTIISVLIIKYFCLILQGSQAKPS